MGARRRLLSALLSLLLVASLTTPELLARASRIQPSPQPPAPVAESTEDQLLRLVKQTWPANANAAISILYCESRIGADQRAWSLDTPDGGPFQINRQSWEHYFLRTKGWSWAQIVLDPATNVAAARVIFDRTGDFSAWSCSRRDPNDNALAAWL